MKNFAASIRARLKQHADAEGEDFELVLTRYALERLLFRMSRSEYSTRFVLKGAMLFALWYDASHRPTRDIDLLGFGSSEPNDIAQVFRQIAGIVAPDGIEFESDSVRVYEIRKADGYGGLRVNLHSTLDGARVAVQIDIGFGDAVTPAPEEARYPTVLADSEAPRLLAYPKASVIAEKVHAICVLGMVNSRMKDYYDLSVLRKEFPATDDGLARAVAATFERRKTPLPPSMPVGLTAAFGEELRANTQWDAFVRRNRLDAPKLAAVVADLGEFFAGIFDQARGLSR